MISSYDVPGDGMYGLVQPDGELMRLRYRGRKWPIWNAPARKTARSDSGWRLFWQLALDAAVTGTPRIGWRPVLFGPIGTGPLWPVALHAEVDKRVWWTHARANAKDRRAYYMPAMPRDDLIVLVHDLEASSETGVKETRKLPIGEWIKRIWNVIERRERGDAMGVSP